MFSRIQVALDGSPFSEQALPVAEALSKTFDAAVEVVSVHEPVVGVEMDGWDESAATWTQDYVSRVGSQFAEKTGREVNSEMLYGTPVRALISHAASTGSDLLIAATHGRGVFSRAWLGSVADGLLRHCDRHLLLVRPEEEGEIDPVSWDRITVPLDGTSSSTEILTTAAAMARAFDATLDLVRVVPFPVEIASPYLPTTIQMNQQVVEDAKGEAVRWLDAQAEQLRARGLKVDTHVTVSLHPAQAICALTEQLGGDLIVMSTHGRKGVERAFLGSTADKVVRSTHTPILVHRASEG